MAATTEWVENNLYRAVVTFPSVAADTTMARAVVPIASFSGRIKQVAFHTANDVRTDFSIFQHATSGFGTVDEVYRIEGLSEFWQRQGHDIQFSNSDDPQATSLWLSVTNYDLAVATGVITLQVYIRASGTGGS